jgi:membrane protein YdbS with pleckstrin-like domain
MSKEEQDKRVILHPNWRHFFFRYLLAIVTIPLVGAGIAMLYRLQKKLSQIQYIITDDHITVNDHKYSHNVDLVDIKNIELQQSRFHHLLGIGTLKLVTSASDMKIEGIANPEKYKQILEKAIFLETNREQTQSVSPPAGPSYQPGNMGKINYLTGLWQQGLLSDDDFQEERGQLD